MTKVTIEIDTETDQGKQELQDYLDVLRIKAALAEFSQNTLRRYRKCGLPKRFYDRSAKNNSPPELLDEVVRHIEEKFYENLEDNKVVLD